MNEGKLTTLANAVARHVEDGAALYLAGFSHALAFSAAHEIMRRRLRDLVLIRATPDLVYDQMVGAGCASKLIFSWAGNPGFGMLECIRRAIENRTLEIEEYTHFSLLARLHAASVGLSFYPLPRTTGAQLAAVNERFATVVCPYSGREHATVPALRPDIAFIHARRADTEGNTELAGVVGDQREAALAARRVVVCAEHIVPSGELRGPAAQNVLPAMVVDAVVHEPWGAHPSYVEGCYERDNAFYTEWAEFSRDEDRVTAYLEEWVYGVRDRADYARRLGARLSALRMRGGAASRLGDLAVTPRSGGR